MPGNWFVAERLSFNKGPTSKGLQSVARLKFGWCCGREAEGGGLLNRYTVEKPYRGFESLRHRHFPSEYFSPRRHTTNLTVPAAQPGSQTAEAGFP